MLLYESIKLFFLQEMLVSPILLSFLHFFFLSFLFLLSAPQRREEGKAPQIRGAESRVRREVYCTNQ